MGYVGVKLATFHTILTNSDWDAFSWEGSASLGSIWFHLMAENPKLGSLGMVKRRTKSRYVQHGKTSGTNSRRSAIASSGTGICHTPSIRRPFLSQQSMLEPAHLGCPKARDLQNEMIEIRFWAHNGRSLVLLDFIFSFTRVLEFNPSLLQDPKNTFRMIYLLTHPPTWECTPLRK